MKDVSGSCSFTFVSDWPESNIRGKKRDGRKSDGMAECGQENQRTGRLTNIQEQPGLFPGCPYQKYEIMRRLFS